MNTIGKTGRVWSSACWRGAAVTLAFMLSACGGGDPASTLQSAVVTDAAAPSVAASVMRPDRRASSVTLVPVTGKAVDAEALMNWAEVTYPQFFPGHQATLFAAPYLYRYYADKGNYAGVEGDNVVIYGPVLTGNKIQVVGRLADFSCLVYPDSCPASLSGTASVGRPLAGAKVTIKDITGRTAVAITSAIGEYRFDDIRDMTWPVLAKVSGGILGCAAGQVCTADVVANSTDYYSAASGNRAVNNTLNLSPLTHAVLAAASAAEPVGLYNDIKLWPAITPDKLAAANANLNAWLTRLNPGFHLAEVVDYLTRPFGPDSSDAQRAALVAWLDAASVLQLDLAKVIRLAGQPASTRTPIVPLFCDVAGHYQGTYSGSSAGTWTAEVDPYMGVLAGLATDAKGFASLGFGLVGRLGVNGQRASATMGVAGLSDFNGSIDSNLVMSGTWSSPLEKGGSFTGTRTAVASPCK